MQLTAVYPINTFLKIGEGSHGNFPVIQNVRIGSARLAGNEEVEQARASVNCGGSCWVFMASQYIRTN